jgi:hypothetical protein
MDIAAKADAAEGIRQGKEDIKAGRVKDARTVCGEFEKRHARGLPFPGKGDSI